MRLVDILIGLSMAVLFAFIILGMVNPTDNDSLYGANNLGVSFDDDTQKAYSNVSGVSSDSLSEYRLMQKQVENKTLGGGDMRTSEDEQQTLEKLGGSSWRAVESTMSTKSTITNIGRVFSSVIGIDKQIWEVLFWALVIIIGLMVIGSVLRQRLEN